MAITITMTGLSSMVTDGNKKSPGTQVSGLCFRRLGRLVLIKVNKNLPKSLQRHALFYC